MAWCRQAPSHYLRQCCPKFMSYGMTRPQWVNIPYLFSYIIFFSVENNVGFISLHRLMKGHATPYSSIQIILSRKSQYLQQLNLVSTQIDGPNYNLIRPCCPACRTTLVATRFRVAVICPIIQVPHCIRVFFYFVWFVFINHIFQFYYELCTYCNILDIYLS